MAPKLSMPRMNSPFSQAAIVSLIMFCCSGMNTTVLGLGAGGSRAEMIPLVDRITTTGLSVTAVLAFFGGTLTNKLGPRITLLIATSGYPTFIAALWLLDQGVAEWYAWVATIWHSLSAALLYPAAGYIVSAYSPEHQRGRYIASMWGSQLFGNVVGCAIVLGITSTTGSKAAGVPTSVYASIVAIQCLGFIFAFFLKNPSDIRRDDGTPIAHFKLLTWKEEISMIPIVFRRPETILLATGILFSQMPFSLAGSLNGFYFSARSRALTNLCNATANLIGTLIMATLCDYSVIGGRRRRSLIAGISAIIVNMIAWSALFWFLATHSLNRKEKSAKIDWTEPSEFVQLFPIFIPLGLAYSAFFTYQIWLCNAFSNEPRKLGRVNGYITAMRMTGSAIAFGIDSHSVAFLTEAEIYFVGLMVGGFLALVSAYKYAKDTHYGDEDLVIVPKNFEPYSSKGSEEAVGVVGVVVKAN